ncbi:ATP-binding protein [Spirulina sp. 06S082]|uniref:ATP-binding protein n=1 Tax=Spirulina sp. 06S082 TaxID=3110248 RepID=UPI002B1EA0E1|nr:ATP-binding protein [Spirulina sp. 06S082]MEA5471073.1 ATP-binding protein [Spirulina sp. 06S082]
MKKQKHTILHQFSLVAGVALFLIVALAFLDFRDRSKTDFILKQQSQYLELKDKLAHIKLEMTLARLDESQMINSRNLKFFQSFEKRIDSILILSKELKKDCQDEKEILEILNNITKILDKYHNSVNHILKIQKNMGLMEKEGILLAIQEVKEKVKYNLELANQEKLIVKFMQMQLDEKDFSNSLDMRIADGLIERTSKLRDEIQIENISLNRKNILQIELDRYRELVSQLTANTLELELVMAESTLQYDLIAPELIKTHELIDILLNSTAEKLRQQRRNSLYQTLIIFGGALVTLVIFMFLQIRSAQELVSRLQELAKGMQEIAAGNFVKANSLPQGDDEVGILTETFLIMSSQIQTQIETIEKEREKAEVANRAKSQFLASMSHELRTPLNAILGFTQLMNRDPALDRHHQKNLDIVLRSGEHLLSLINDVLDMSKIEAGRMILNENGFDLYRLLDTVENMLRLKAENQNIQLIFERSSHLPQYIKTDEGKLRQVLINLLGNAIKFTKIGRVVLRVSSKISELENDDINKINFEIEDTGEGIAPEEIDRLFEAFVQTETGRNSGKGTGLGLPISQRFVGLMGGEITASSIVGKGTIFAFSIDAERVESEGVETEIETRRAIALQPDLPNYRIAIVDDRLENRLLLNELLVSVGFEVREANDGKEAIALWESWQPQLIWMDIQMPKMDGYEATRYIRNLEEKRKEAQPVIIIALTASVLDDERAAVFEAGCNDFVSKPFQEAVLFDRMAKYLGVRYIYDEPDTSSLLPVDKPTDIKDLSMQLKAVPIDWIVSVNQSCVEADSDRVIKLIEQIRDRHPEIAHSLTHLVDNFQFEQLIQATQTILLDNCISQ